MHLVVTGGSGYIGTRLIRRARDQGWWITVLSRHKPPMSGGQRVRWFPWALNKEPPPRAFEGGDGFPAATALIHLAHQWEKGPEDLDLNREGAQLLLDSSRRHHVGRFVFVSSFSARHDALNLYGRTKDAVESLLEGDGEVVARFGIIYGGPLKGQWGSLCRITGLSPVLPMVGAGRPVQAIHLDDACEGLLRLAGTQKLNRKIYSLAGPSPLPFGRLLRHIARQVHGRGLLIVPVSTRLVLTALGIMERLGLPVSGTKERVLGLAGIPVLDTGDSLGALGLDLRDLKGGLAASAPGRLRRLVREGAAMLHYLLGERPSAKLLRRYVRGVLRFGNATHVALPAPVRWWPPLLRAVEPVSMDQGHGLRARLDLAARVIEASPEGVSRYYAWRGEGRTTTVLNIFLTLGVEALLFPVRLILGHRLR